MQSLISENFIIHQLLMVESGSYHEQPLRPYTANADGSRVAQIAEISNFGRNYMPTTIAGIASQILVPSTEVYGSAAIANGWSCPRFRFMMEVTCDGPFGDNLRYILTGYTDHADVSHGGLLDPNLAFYINNVVILATVHEQTPMGVIERTRLVNAMHLLADHNKTDMISMRPDDLFSAASSLSYVNRQDHRVGFTFGAKLSYRNNGAPSSYLSRALSAQRDAMSMDDGTSDLSATMERAQGIVREQSFSQVVPLHILRSKTSFKDYSSVTFAELDRLSPGLDEVTHIQMARSSPVPVANQNNSEHFYGKTNETLAATVIGQSVPALMMDCILTSVCFSVTNDAYGAQTSFFFGDVRAFSNVDLTPFIEAFQHRFLTEIYPGLTRNNALIVSLEVDMDIRGDSFIKISVDNQGVYEFILPTFADALTPPVLANDVQILDSLASTITHLGDQITNAFN